MKLSNTAVHIFTSVELGGVSSTALETRAALSPPELAEPGFWHSQLERQELHRQNFPLIRGKSPPQMVYRVDYGY